MNKVTKMQLGGTDIADHLSSPKDQETNSKQITSKSNDLNPYGNTDSSILQVEADMDKVPTVHDIQIYNREKNDSFDVVPVLKEEIQPSFQLQDSDVQRLLLMDIPTRRTVLSCYRTKRKACTFYYYPLYKDDMATPHFMKLINKCSSFDLRILNGETFGTGMFMFATPELTKWAVDIIKTNFSHSERMQGNRGKQRITFPENCAITENDFIKFQKDHHLNYYVNDVYKLRKSLLVVLNIPDETTEEELSDIFHEAVFIFIEKEHHAAFVEFKNGAQVAHFCKEFNGQHLHGKEVYLFPYSVAIDYEQPAKDRRSVPAYLQEYVHPLTAQEKIERKKQRKELTELSQATEITEEVRQRILEKINDVKSQISSTVIAQKELKDPNFGKRKVKNLLKTLERLETSLDRDHSIKWAKGEISSLMPMPDEPLTFASDWNNLLKKHGPHLTKKQLKRLENKRNCGAQPHEPKEVYPICLGDEYEKPAKKQKPIPETVASRDPHINTQKSSAEAHKVQAVGHVELKSKASQEKQMEIMRKQQQLNKKRDGKHNKQDSSKQYLKRQGADSHPPFKGKGRGKFSNQHNDQLRDKSRDCYHDYDETQYNDSWDWNEQERFGSEYWRDQSYGQRYNWPAEEHGQHDWSDEETRRWERDEEWYEEDEYDWNKNSRDWHGWDYDRYTDHYDTNDERDFDWHKDHYDHGKSVGKVSTSSKNGQGNYHKQDSKGKSNSRKRKYQAEEKSENSQLSKEKSSLRNNRGYEQKTEGSFETDESDDEMLEQLEAIIKEKRKTSAGEYHNTKRSLGRSTIHNKNDYQAKHPVVVKAFGVHRDKPEQSGRWDSKVKDGNIKLAKQGKSEDNEKDGVEKVNDTSGKSKFKSHAEETETAKEKFLDSHLILGTLQNALLEAESNKSNTTQIKTKYFGGRSSLSSAVPVVSQPALMSVPPQPVNPGVLTSVYGVSSAPQIQPSVQQPTYQPGYAQSIKPPQPQMPVQGQVPLQMPVQGQIPVQGQMSVQGQVPIQGHMSVQIPMSGQAKLPPSAPVQTSVPMQTTARIPLPGQFPAHGLLQLPPRQMPPLPRQMHPLPSSVQNSAHIQGPPSIQSSSLPAVHIPPPNVPPPQIQTTPYQLQNPVNISSQSASYCQVPPPNYLRMSTFSSSQQKESESEEEHDDTEIQIESKGLVPEIKRKAPAQKQKKKGVPLLSHASCILPESARSMPHVTNPPEGVPPVASSNTAAMATHGALQSRHIPGSNITWPV